EDNRHLHRELGELRKERTRLTNRIQGLLAGQGVRIVVRKDLPEQLAAARLWSGSPLPEGLHTRLLREWERVKVVDGQIRELEGDRKELVAEWEGEEAEKVRQLMHLRGIGEAGAWVLVMEFFGWRQFANRRQVGSLSGLASTPHLSGDLERNRGISKAGNRRVRALAVELAWSWLLFQPGSKLARWYEARFGKGSKRLRKIGIVALARKLLVELWRYLETGALPEGATTKA
ncbi:MAG: transposase, partial [candidate division NC10 bacterium]|nr:transposase [candidate division NC10 bacterium]